jgi:hypothetical protein
MSKSRGSKGKNNCTVDNPTELLAGLAKGVKLKGPLKQELAKASAASVDRKLARAK